MHSIEVRMQKARLACVTIGSKEGHFQVVGVQRHRGRLCAFLCHKRIESAPPYENHSREYCKIFTISDDDTI